MQYQLAVLLVCLASTAYALLGVGRTQSTAVRGQLMCNGRPASGVKVKLYEKEATFDVKMAEGVTDNNGYFQLQGYKTEISTIDPKLNIYHKCNYNGLCYKKIGMTIPDQFVSSGRNPSKVFDIGQINLASQFTGQTTDCIN
ncbi:hypothetical protein WR25_24946 isoform A [Diploscapter pachys]|uniref:Transthyretin-like family protein n=1 Tax=Diploscapter pachys TaxID=2018661 RepID=A0A2A2J2P4_9BILA|nr:hypothetical protein WR25_24946 isoform A [Diploscapter pachys]